MREAGVAVLADVEERLDDEARRLRRARSSTTWWRGSAAEAARALWSTQARHLRDAAAAMTEARQALREFAHLAEHARARLARAELVLTGTGPLDELFDQDAAGRAQAAREERTAATSELEDAARRLASRLEVLEAAAQIPPAGAGPCAPPSPAPPARGWGRVADIVFGPAESGLFDYRTCRPIPVLEAGGGGAILRGLARKQAAATTRERLIADVAQNVLSNQENRHAFKHADQLFGYKQISEAQRLEWARLIAAGLQSTKTFAYRGGSLEGVGHLHQAYGRYWVIVQDPVTGIVKSTITPNAAQLAAIRRLLRGH